MLHSATHARRVSANGWEVQRDSQSVLQAMQKMVDRQKTLSVGGVLRSDERLPILPLGPPCPGLRGREDPRTRRRGERAELPNAGIDRRQSVLRSTIPGECRRCANAGGLRVNQFVRFRRVLAAGRPRIEVEELGSAESILEDRGYLRQTVQQLARKGSRQRRRVGPAGWGALSAGCQPGRGQLTTRAAGGWLKQVTAIYKLREVSAIKLT
jgi:hypothetical protein